MKRKAEVGILAILIITLILFVSIAVTGLVASAIYNQQVKNTEKKQITFYKWDNRCEEVKQLSIYESKITESVIN